MVSPSTQCGLVKVAAGGGGSTGSCFREEECGQECSTVTSSQCSTTTETQCQVQHVMKCNTQRRPSTLWNSCFCNIFYSTVCR